MLAYLRNVDMVVSFMYAIALFVQTQVCAQLMWNHMQEESAARACMFALA